MADMMGAAQMLEVFARKHEEFSMNVENKHLVWLREIEEEARRMFSSDFNAEPELMPKTPSQKRRRKKARPSGVPEEDSTRRRLSRRSNNWRSSIRRLSMKLQNMEAVEEQTFTQQETQRVTRLTRAQAQKAVCTNPDSDSRKVSELPVVQPPFSSLPCVKISTKDRKSAEDALETLTPIEEVRFSSKETISSPPKVQPSAVLDASKTPEGKCRSANKVKIAASTPKEVGMNDDIVHMDTSVNREENAAPLLEISTQSHEMEEMDIQLINLSADAQEGIRVPVTDVSRISVSKSTPTGSKSDRRSVRRSLVGRHSRRHSLMDKYSLASKRESMTREAMRKSIRRSISKKAWESSASSYQSSTDGMDEGTIKARPELIPLPSAEEKEDGQSPRRSLRSRNAKKIAISNLSELEQQIPRVTRQKLADSKAEEEKENAPDARLEFQDTQSARRKSYKRAVDSLYDEGLDGQHGDVGQSPPRKKTPSPPCPNNKVVRPPPAHLRTFLHTVQKNQMLMSTPGSGCSSSKSNIVKSFIKRTTPLKSDNKERERQRLENLRKKQEAEIQRKLKMEEEKKRKLEELKLRREERQRKVLQARERVEQIGEEKKRKIEQKFAQIDEKSEKVREDRLAEEKAKKKLTAKKMEEAEVRRRQDEEARRQKIQQMEEEERKHQELMQKKREEEDQERAKKIAEAKKLAEQRQAEQERERQREQQLAAEKDLERQKELERMQAEKERERQEKERTLQLQREQERAAREEAAAQEKERLWKEVEERKKKEQQERQEKLRKELEQERRAKEEQERRAKEEQERRLREERRAKEEREMKAKEQQAALVAKSLNVTLDVPKSPASESYKMTPQGSKPKPPKICDEDYGMDINSGDSTDDESEPRKPIPAWASGKLLTDAMRQQFYNPINVDRTFGRIESPKLEEMFYKNKPRYLKRTSSAVWHSPPLTNHRSNVLIPYGSKKY
ncbi:inner centromere protein isoform X2 [Pleurodeles waltl]|uniref:inner centromere protein isoform X2 n=1 Tax=Pleurodeles waltl TaxID=8319 RepID=UPI003709AB5D